MSEKITKLIKRDSSQLNSRVLELMKENQLTIYELSQHSGVAVGTIQKMLVDPACNPTLSSLKSVCDALGVSIGELIGQEKKLISQKKRAVYVFDWEELPFITDDFNHTTELNFKSRELIETTCVVTEKAFALRTRDNSLLPLFPENSILIFDPGKNPNHNDYVLVQIHDHQALFFKKFLIDKPFCYVVSINPIFKDTAFHLGSNDHVVAVLVQSQMQY